MLNLSATNQPFKTYYSKQCMKAIQINEPFYVEKDGEFYHGDEGDYLVEAFGRRFVQGKDFFERAWGLRSDGDSLHSGGY